ncbi:MAG: SDR family oxidoreductase [Flavobacteriales bacterium]|nr:SDR family oxidoreductase [Flavobacteriales bacterium]NNK80930.1 SDR family oxidoreductase [Flavobacteriales bacterium]
MNMKRALVCGASKGIGKAIAYKLASEGMEVILLARGEDDLARIQEDLDSNNGQVHKYYAVDFMRPERVVEALQNELIESHRIHILINNTGGPEPGLLHEAELQSLADAFTMHILTSQALMKALLPGMEQAGFGRIVNIISTSVKEPIDGLGVSNTIRGAMASWSKTLSRELGEKGVTVNNVLPGYTSTERLTEIIDMRAVTAGVDLEVMTSKLKREVPANRFALPEEIAGVVSFLCSDSASYLNGTNITVDGGRTRCL